MERGRTTMAVEIYSGTGTLLGRQVGFVTGGGEVCAGRARSWVPRWGS
jgi:hypothetical protein